MDNTLKERFIEKWENYFNGVELPIAFYYADRVELGDRRESKSQYRCLIGNLERVRQGYAFIYHRNTPGCAGGKRYSGYAQKLRSDFEYFLSCGIPGKVDGERYKKSPELVKEFLKGVPPFQAPGKYLVFKRWDKLRQDEEPSAVIFFATPDVISGLFTLANFDIEGLEGVIAPMGSGCASIIKYPLDQAISQVPKAVLGMFDVSARPEVPANTLTFTVPMMRFVQMIDHMDQSFLITQSWRDVKTRIRGQIYDQKIIPSSN